MSDSIPYDPAPIPGVTLDKAFDAAWVVFCRCPHDTAELLEMLGLLEDGRIVAPRPVSPLAAMTDRPVVGG